MERTSWVPGIRAGAASLVAALALLCLPGTSIAGGSAAAAATASAAPSAPLTRGVGFDRPDGAAQVRALQRRLQELGQRPGPVDGLFGPLTEAAVERFQLAQGLDADGIVGPHTRRALQEASRPPIGRGAGYGQRGGSPRVRVVQRRLRQLGQRPGPIDGLFGPKTEAAVERFQRTSHLVADGVVGSHTVRALTSAEHAGGGTPARSAGHARRPKQQTRAQAPRSAAGGTKAGHTTTSRGPSRAAGGKRATRANRRQPAGAREANNPVPWRLLAVVLLGLALAALVAALALGGVRRRVAAPLAEATVGKTREVARPVGRVPASLQAVGVGGRSSRSTDEARAVASDRERPRPSPPKQDQTRRSSASPPRAAGPAEGGRDNGMRALAYVSVRPEPGARAELRKQLAPIDALCRRRGWRLQNVVRDVERPELEDESRPGLAYALERLARREASCLVVAQLGRLSRSAAELGETMEWFKRHRIRLVVLDIELDTGTPVGQMAADALISVGARERERLAARARQGPARDAFKAGAVGRPAVGDIPALKKYIAALRSNGMTLQGIADRLNAEGVPTLRGGQKWRPSSVQAAVGYRRPPPRPAQSQVQRGRSDVSGGES